MSMHEAEFDAIRREFAQAGTIYLTSHDRPDGDALGSVLGLSRILRQAGMANSVVGCLPVPDRYGFLLEGVTLDVLPEKPEVKNAVLCVLDTGSICRSEPAKLWKEAGGRIVNLDHHASNDQFGDVNCVVTDASSASEIVADFAQHCGFGVDRAAAEALWTGLITDTGRFSFSNTTAHALSCGAYLLGQGVLPEKAAELLYQCNLPESVRLKARAVESLEMLHGGKVGAVSLRARDFAETGCSPADAGEIVDVPRNLKGVCIGLYFYELPDSASTKVSVRTYAPYDATQLVAKFKGGGHLRAAGCSIDKPLDQAKPEFLAALSELWGGVLGGA